MTPDEHEPRGTFDDLLETPADRRRATRAELDVAHLVAAAIEAIREGAIPLPRGRTCCRCEAQADHARRHNELVVPPRQAQSWVYQGRRYWAATCAPCTDLEWSALWQRRYDAAEKSPAEQRRLTEIATVRQAQLAPLGRRIHVNLPPTAQHAAYGAR